MGSPHVEGLNGKLLESALKGQQAGFFVGSADDLTSETLAVKEKEAFGVGARLVDAIRAARNSDLSLAS